MPNENISPDSAGNIYYCNPMFMNPTVMLGNDTISDWTQVDFRLREGSPCINSGVLEGTDFAEESTDLAGERRIKQCAIDRGCYEYGTIVRDTLYETCCLEADSVEGFVYMGHGFTFLQPHLGLQYQDRYQCKSAAPDTILTLGLYVHTISYAVDTLVGCDSVEWHNYLFSESGEYVRTIPSSTGCDSIVTLHVTVRLSPEIGNLTPEIRVYDVYGRMMSVVVGVNDYSPLQTVQIDLSNYATGIYIVKLVNNGKVVAAQKVMKE